MFLNFTSKSIYMQIFFNVLMQSFFSEKKKNPIKAAENVGILRQKAQRKTPV